MTRLLATGWHLWQAISGEYGPAIADHVRGHCAALLEHVDAARDCWGRAEEAQEAAVAPPGVEVGSGSTDDAKGAQIGAEGIETRETR